MSLTRYLAVIALLLASLVSAADSPVPVDVDAPYDAVEEALRAVKDSGIKVDLGFVGNESKE